MSVRVQLFCNKNRLIVEPSSEFLPLCGPLVIHAANNKLFHTQSTKDGSRDSEVRKIKMQLCTPFCTSAVNFRTSGSGIATLFPIVRSIKSADKQIDKSIRRTNFGCCCTHKYIV